MLLREVVGEATPASLAASATGAPEPCHPGPLPALRPDRQQSATVPVPIPDDPHMAEVALAPQLQEHCPMEAHAGIAAETSPAPAQAVHSIYVTQGNLSWEEPSASTRTLGPVKGGAQ